MKRKGVSQFDGCYAKHLGRCNHRSREHFVSKSILEIIGPFSIQGFPWLKPGEVGRASASSLAASVLCDYHNSMLSDFDNEAAKFFTHLKLLDSKVTPEQLADVPSVLTIDGTRLEKWFLKILCGTMASGNFLIDGKSFGKLPPSEYMVNLLFLNERWREGIGLYADYVGRKRVNAHRGIGYDPVTARSGTSATIVGIDVHFWGFPLRGLFATYEHGSPLQGYRPAGMSIVNQDVVREVVFSWPTNSPSSPGLVFTRDGTI